MLDRDHNLAVVYQQPTTTRTERHSTPLSRTHDVRFCPGIVGGSEWNGASYDPALNLIFVRRGRLVVRQCEFRPRRRSFRLRGTLWFGAETPAEKIFDPVDQARGRVTAFDADTGAVRWRFQTARPVNAAVTPTAFGGLVFTADLGGQLLCVRRKNWSGPLAMHEDGTNPTGGGIVTYLANGGQRVAVASGMKSPIWPWCRGREPNRNLWR